jgi:hypothetical protein
MTTYSKALPLLLALAAPPLAGVPEYETPGIVAAGAVLPATLRQSIHHTVLDDVRVEDGFYVFRLDSNLGTFEVRSLALLEIRVHEIKTMAEALAQFSGTDGDVASAVRGRRGVGSDSVVDILADPVSTATELATNLSSNLEETLSGRYLQTEHEEPAPQSLPAEPPGPYKRSVAQQLHLDVYSSSPEVQHFLDRIATVRSGGRLEGATATVSPYRHSGEFAGEAVLQARVDTLVKNKDPDELRLINARRLRSAGVPGEIADRFLDNAAISPRRQTAIVSYLDLLEGVERPDALIELAASAGSEVDALAYDNLARMLARCHHGDAGLVRLEIGIELGAAVARDGRLLYFLPIDRITWSAETERILDRLREHADAAGHRDRELILSGTVSEAVRVALAERAIGLRERF